MLAFKYKRFFITNSHFFYINEKVIEKKSGLVFYHNLDEKQLEGYKLLSKTCKVRKQFSLISDLSCGEEAVLQGIRKNYRYEIRRSEKEGICVDNYYGRDVFKKKALLNRFAKTYYDMFKQQNIVRRLNCGILKALAKRDALLISVAKLNGIEMVYHAYILDKNNAILLYSTSIVHTDKEIANKIGRMNKYLHWKDITELIKKEIFNLDWGGVNSLEEPNGIAMFKMAFGGQPITYYHVTVANNPIANILLEKFY